MRQRLIKILLIAAVVLVIAIAAVLVFVPRQPATTPPPQPTTDLSLTPAPEATPAPTPEAATVPTTSSSAEDVIRYYFSCWNAKDTAGMDDCRITQDRGLYSYEDLEYQAEIRLHSLTSFSKDEIGDQFDAEWYASPVDIALVEASFYIEYNDLGKESFVSEGVEHSGYRFWMVKESEDTPWRIALQGY